jgi:hypothetical protein
MPAAGDGGNGTAPPAAGANGEHRRTLHLSLGSPPARNGGGQPADARQHPEPAALAQPAPEPVLATPTRPHNGDAGAATNAAPATPAPTIYPEHARRNGAEAAPQKDGGAFIDRELRARVDGDIAAFLAAFDAALAHDSQENRAALREATDRLLRAGARTRIELERLEARLPLPPRGDGRSGDTAWRTR